LGNGDEDAIDFSFVIYIPLLFGEIYLLSLHVFAINKNLSDVVFVEVVQFSTLVELILECFVFYAHEIIFNEVGQQICVAFLRNYDEFEAVRVSFEECWHFYWHHDLSFYFLQKIDVMIIDKHLYW
jgi:hypothetical protein